MVREGLPFEWPTVIVKEQRARILCGHELRTMLGKVLL
jgi:hypothetical protein